jgi:hypothetical protein
MARPVLRDGNMSKYCSLAACVVVLGGLGCPKSSSKPTGEDMALDMAPPLVADMAATSDLGSAHDLALGGDGGTVHLCNGPIPGQCCDADNQPAGEATCDDHGGWVCAPGTSLCRCGDDLESFNCTDFCGSDEFFRPDCRNGKWECQDWVPVHTDTCKPGTCWGYPPECCDQDGQPMALGCDDGRWTCGGTWCYLLDGGVH